MQKIITPAAKLSEPTHIVKDALHKVLEGSLSGFPQIPKKTVYFESSQKLADQLLKSYSQFLIVGIGGSSMGARALVEVAGVSNIHFLDNVDAIEFNRLWTQVSQGAHKTAFIFISKSGSTIEILWNYSMLETQLASRNIQLSGQSFFVTENTDSPLAKMARAHSRPLLEVPLEIGGRYSVLTPVGLLVAALSGYSLSDLKKGAAEAVADEALVLSSCVQFLESFKRGEVITLFWFYSSAYRWFGSWLEQLWAESLGKMNDMSGGPAPGFSTPMTAIGARDQHSILQQVAHGTKNKFVCFFNFLSSQGGPKMSHLSFDEISFAKHKNYGKLIAKQALATQDALTQNGVSTTSSFIDDGNMSLTMGYLFMHFQLVVATLGLSLNTNPFDQPGVALGKELTLEKLKTD